MPDTPLAVAESVAERLREGVAGKPFARQDGGPELQITVSLGVAVITGQGDNPKELLARADEALYRAKSGGRNRVVIATNEFEAVSSSGSGLI
jgi:two-component system cell cycle response regulator